MVLLCHSIYLRHHNIPHLHGSYTHRFTRTLRPLGRTCNTHHWEPCAPALNDSFCRTITAPVDALKHCNVTEPQNFNRANSREGSYDRRGPERHLARAGGGPRTGLDSRPPAAARLSLQYGRYSLPRWSSSLISTPNLDDDVFCNRSVLVRVHCTYSYTHFKRKPGALAKRSDETSVPFVGTFRTGVGRRGCGLAGELPPRRLAALRIRLAFLWMKGGHTEWTAYTARLAAIFAGERRCRGPGAEAGSELRALAVPNFAAQAAATDVLVYQASGSMIPPRGRIRELGFRSARVAPLRCRPLPVVLQRYPLWNTSRQCNYASIFVPLIAFIFPSISLLRSNSFMETHSIARCVQRQRKSNVYANASPWKSPYISTTLPMFDFGARRPRCASRPRLSP